jgi:hypothetical protein
MRRLVISVAALTILAAPAEAKWEFFACPSENFATEFPDTPKVESVQFAMPRHKAALSAKTYTATVDGITYKMLVADYSDRVPFGASILEEAVFEHTEADDHGAQNGTIVRNDTARIEPVVRGATYGRRVTMDLANKGGRSITTFYFHEGKLYEQSATISPANGDYTSPYGTRFVESLLFNLTRLDDEAGGEAKMIAGCGTDLPPFKY